MTSAPAVDERLHRDAVDAALDEEHLYDYGLVPGLDNNPGETPRIHWLRSIERRYVEPRRAGRAGRSGWRLSIRYVGRTPDEARHAQLVATTAVDEKRLTVGGHLSTPVTHESTSPIEPDDDGWWSGLTNWTYVL